jgi:hypothetical protein
MKKVIYLITICLTSIVLFNSCNNDDDGPETVPLRDRTEEAVAAQLEIEEYLETHFYNYEDFENPPAEFDFRIVFDTIAGDNSNKTPLIEQVNSKMVRDRLEEGLMYKLYFLKVIQGGGVSPNFPDIVNNTYEGRLLDNTLFDSSTIPVRFDLTNVINGYQDIVKEFNGASNIIQNPDGSLDFEDFGVGAMFIPSGLGYYGSGQGAIIDPYDQLIFTFQLYTVEAGDQDNDGVLSINEDLNENGFEEDDDTDEDGLPNYFDNDDDNDGILTRNEIEIDDEGNVTFPDADGDGTPDYLDSDS